MNSITESSTVNESVVNDRSGDREGSPINQPRIEQVGAKTSVIRRLMKALMMVALLIGVVVFVLYKKRVEIPAMGTAKIYAHLDSMSVRAEHTKEYITHQYELHFGKHEAEVHLEPHKILVTSPMAKNVTITQEYVCQIHSRKHIDVCALETGYLEAIPVREGQAVKADEALFSVNSILYKARLDAEKAERDYSKQELANTERLFAKGGVSENEVKLYAAKLAKAQAKVDLAQAEFNFATVKAPFDGIIDRLHHMQGSLVKEGDILTTLSDNRVMWVYFNVTEKRYLEYMAESGYDLRLIMWNEGSEEVPTSGKNLVVVGTDQKGLLHIRIFDFSGKNIADKDETQLPENAAAIATLKQQLPTLLPPHELSDSEKAKVIGGATTIVGLTPDSGQNKQNPDIVLMLANHEKFPHVGRIGAIEANFNNETGNISFRADFSNSEGLLRYGQTGTVLISRTLKNAIVIPQRATFENLAKRYAFVVGEDDVVHQREIAYIHEQDDIFVISKGLTVKDKIVLEGIRQIKDGDKLEFEFVKPEDAMKDLKHHAE